MKTLILIALLLIGAAAAAVKPAASIAIDLAGDGSINVDTYTYGGPDQVAHFCSTATISYPNGSYLSVLSVTTTNVADGANEYLDADVSQTQLTKSYNPTTGQLTISGVASVATYQQVLRSVYYVDALTSPTVGPRLIDVQASYGTTGSNTAVCTLAVQRNPSAASATKAPVSATAASASPSGSSSTPTTAQLSQTLTSAQTLTPPYLDLSGGNGGPNWSTWTYRRAHVLRPHLPECYRFVRGHAHLRHDHAHQSSGWLFRILGRAELHPERAQHAGLQPRHGAAHHHRKREFSGVPGVIAVACVCGSEYTPEHFGTLDYGQD
jgi:hypothetical protein